MTARRQQARLLIPPAFLVAALLALAAFATRPAPPARAQTETLVAGWNTIVYQGPQAPAAEVFGSLGDSLIGAFVQPPGEQFGTWYYYFPGEASRFSTIEVVYPMRTYWLNMAAGAEFTLPDAQTTLAPSAPTAPRPAAPMPELTLPAGATWTFAEAGLATWYGPGFEGNSTACGDVFDPALPTAASNTLPCGAIARVTNTATGRSVVVKINDTGGFGPPLIIDLSQAAYHSIAAQGDGHIPIVIEIAE